MVREGEPALLEGQLAATWLEQLRAWLHDAEQAGVAEANAMVLATADADGQPSARSVLLKDCDEQGLTFFTNLHSRKGLELAANPRASLVFPWYALHRQVVVVGTATPVETAEADAYFATRPYGSRISAHASPQSQVLSDRAELEHAWSLAERRWPEGDAVPRPEHWGGLRVAPVTVEFWQGRRDRLHDRLRYRRLRDGAFVVERLAP